MLDTLDEIGEDIIGLPKKSIPPYLDKYKGEDYVDVGTLQEPNFETIYELKPDLIIISARQASLYDEFKKIAPTVYLPTDGGDYMNSFKTNMGILGQIFDKEDILTEKIQEIENAIIALNEKAKSNDKNALFIMANDGNLSAFGRGSRFGILYGEFGVNPVDEGIEVTTHGDKIAFEYIVEKNPDYIYVMDRAAIAGGDISAEQVMDNDLIKSTDAYKNDRITYLDAHIWYVSSGGLTGTRKMVEEIESSLEK
jgi:iron complex transport system substrate-binding protein